MPHGPPKRPLSRIRCPTARPSDPSRGSGAPRPAQATPLEDPAPPPGPMAARMPHGRRPPQTAAEGERFSLAPGGAVHTLPSACGTYVCAYFAQCVWDLSRGTSRSTSSYFVVREGLQVGERRATSRKLVGTGGARGSLLVGESRATSSYFADREGLRESRATSMELVGTGGGN